MAKTALIVGASRGLGLGMVRELSGRGWSVLATERTQSQELRATGAEVHRADVTDPESIAALGAALGGRSIDLLFFVSGIWGPPHQDPARATREEVTALFLTNAVGPIAAAEALAPRVAERGVIAFMSSGLGSVSGNSSGGSTLYRGSKAALNTMGIAFAHSDAARGRAVVLMDPGWVKTDMGGPGAPLSVEQSARGMADVLTAAGDQGGARFLNWRGETVGW